MTESQFYPIKQPGIEGAMRHAGDHHDAGRRLRALARDPGVRLRFREHALREMAKDGIAQPDILSMLKRCSVVKVEQNRVEETWNAVGTDRDETRITAVILVDEIVITIKVVTAWPHRR